MYENLLISVNAVLPLMICMAAGYLFRMAHLVDEPFCRKCNTFCFKTFLPLMIFMNVYNSDLESAVQPGAFGFAAAAVLVEDFLVTAACLAMCAASILRNFEGTLPYLSALIALEQVKVGVVLPFVINKAKAENTRGSITYETAVRETRVDC